MIVSRKEAKALNEKWYFTGEPCKNGHIAKRQVANRTCYTCDKQKCKEWRIKNPDKLYEISKKNRTKNPEKHNQRNKKWRTKNPEVVNNLTAKYRSCIRRGAVFYEVYKEEIKAIYKKCNYVSKVTGIKHHVDHIVPVAHNLVCALHVPWNLQIIPASMNRSKNNKFEII